MMKRKLPSTAFLAWLCKDLLVIHAFRAPTKLFESTTKNVGTLLYNKPYTTSTITHINPDRLTRFSTDSGEHQQQPQDQSDPSALFQGRTGSKGIWRPDKQDVERISWGKPAKKKGTGSRGVPHRLNQDERLLFDQARVKGFLEVAGSAWRAERRGAPLLNTYRSWCDACAHASIVLHKGKTGQDDAIVVDISPLRLATLDELQTVANVCAHQYTGGKIEAQGANTNEMVLDEEERQAEALLLSDEDAWETRPIYQLPPYCIVWENLERNDAKELAKAMANLCQTPEKGAKGRQKASKKPRGVKPGKSRRHGGYGIG